MNSIFQSATLRLTGWYLTILMLVSVSFSFAIFQIASTEVRTRLDRFQTTFQESIQIIPPGNRVNNFRAQELDKASENLSIELLYANLIVLVVGGFGSYYLARRTLYPIEKAHESQSRFTSDASHELRTPLAVMKAEIEVALRDKDPTISELKETLSSNLEEIDKLTRLSEMLLNLSRLEHAKLKMCPIDLNKAAQCIVKDFKLPPGRVAINGKKHQIVSANETALNDLIRILVDNALLYSPNDSKVHINISKHDDFAKFEITNQGSGIAAEKMPHIFDRFYRADTSRTNGEKKGYGLGLALAKNIVELHNGRISVTSELEKETTFTLLLPLNHRLQAKTKN